MVDSIQDIIKKVSPYYAKNDAEASHTIVYDSGMETLEPIYFFILDLMNEFGLSPKKFADSFTSSPGSGHFSELGMKSAQMQQQAVQMMGQINTVLRSTLNIIYDLKEFRIRLADYDKFRSKDKDEKYAALLSLKQIWMDKVDINKGQSSIKGMALGQAGFQTLIDAFLIVEDEKLKNAEGKEIDLNDRVKRILKQRILEFNNWLKESERELRKRFELERNYLKSQVNSLKLYSRWAKPYLRAASELEQGTKTREAALVKTFNTIMLDLTLLGMHKLDAEAIEEAAYNTDLPEDFRKMSKQLTKKRVYNSCILVDFKFRGIPQKIPQQQHYVFGGRVEVEFKAYALNDDELAKIDEELEKSDIGDVLEMIDGMTDESLGQLQEDIDEFLDDKTFEEEKQKAKSSGGNPFLALIGRYNKSGEEKPKEVSTEGEKEIKKPTGPVRKDDYIEGEHLRPLAAKNAADNAFLLFDIYKKAHQMESYT